MKFLVALFLSVVFYGPVMAMEDNMGGVLTLKPIFSSSEPRFSPSMGARYRSMGPTLDQLRKHQEEMREVSSPPPCRAGGTFVWSPPRSAAAERPEPSLADLRQHLAAKREARATARPSIRTGSSVDRDRGDKGREEGETSSDDDSFSSSPGSFEGDLPLPLSPSHSLVAENLKGLFPHTRGRLPKKRPPAQPAEAKPPLHPRLVAALLSRPDTPKGRHNDSYVLDEPPENPVDRTALATAEPCDCSRLEGAVTDPTRAKTPCDHWLLGELGPSRMTTPGTPPGLVIVGTPIPRRAPAPWSPDSPGRGLPEDPMGFVPRDKPIEPMTEERFLEMLQRNVNLAGVFYYRRSISYILEPFGQLMRHIKEVSVKLCGGHGVPGAKNVGAWNIFTVDGSGTLGTLDFKGLENVFFLSGESPVKLSEMDDIPPAPGVVAGDPLGADSKAKSANKLSTLKPFELEGLQVRGGLRKPTITFSDGDMTYKAKSLKPHKEEAAAHNAERMGETFEATLRGVQLAYEAAPITSIRLLQGFIEHAAKNALTKATKAGAPEKVAEAEAAFLARKRQFEEALKVVQETGNIRSLVRLLLPNQIGQILGHSEQVMARVFLDRILPLIGEHNTRVAAEDSNTAVKEVLLCVASLHDCCWWCSRTLAGLAGQKRLPYPYDDQYVNVRVMVKGGIAFPTKHFQTTEAPIESVSSRRHMTRLRGIDWADYPVLFSYGE